MHKYQYTILLTLLLALFGCKSKSSNPIAEIFEKSLFDESQVVDIMKSGIEADHSMDSLVLRPESTDSLMASMTDQYYRRRFERGLGLLWFGEKAPNVAFEEFQKLADSVQYHGLEPSRYLNYADSNVNLIYQSYKHHREISPELLATTERLFTINFMRLTSGLLFGQTHPRDYFTHKKWSATNDSLLHIDEILNSMNNAGYYATLMDSLTPKHLWYQALVTHMKNLKALQSADSLEEIKLDKIIQPGDTGYFIQPIYQRLNRFFGDTTKDTTYYDQHLRDLVQRYKRLYRRDLSDTIDYQFVADLNKPIDNQIEKLKKDFERWHWSGRTFGPEYVLVNIPEFRLYVIENDSIKMHMNCVVGKTSRMTPTIDAQMTDLVINPTWTVPPTILKNDILPSIRRRGGYAVSRRGLTAYDRRGRRVNPARINASNYKYYRYVQKPSYNNSLGTVKFNMPNRELVYIHDTNHRWGFNNSYRAHSSGCVRVQHPRDMAALMLGPQGYDREIIDSMIKKANTMSVKLDREVVSHFMYFTTGLDSTGSLVYYPDVYKHNEVFELGTL